MTDYSDAAKARHRKVQARQRVGQDTHEHKFQREGGTWACWGWDGHCGLRAPACFTPREDALTEAGKTDYAAMEAERAADFMATHIMFVSVP